MAKPKQYFHDRVILLFLAVNSFLVLAITASILLRVGGDFGDEYIREYRSNLGLDAFQSGGIADILSFVGFALIVFTVQLLLSKKLYDFRRDGALIIVIMTTLTLIFALIVGNALLTIR
jgi:hypothetical protein